MEIKINLLKIFMKMVKFRPWKTLTSHRKGHGKSWNFKSPKEYKPWKTSSLMLEQKAIFYQEKVAKKIFDC